MESPTPCALWGKGEQKKEASGPYIAPDRGIFNQDAGETGADTEFTAAAVSRIPRYPGAGTYLGAFGVSTAAEFVAGRGSLFLGL